jgi:hypothetical protein
MTFCTGSLVLHQLLFLSYPTKKILVFLSSYDVTSLQRHFLAGFGSCLATYQKIIRNGIAILSDPWLGSPACRWVCWFGCASESWDFCSELQIRERLQQPISTTLSLCWSLLLEWNREGSE